jgi:tetratricopeptide (TPR) repeat protein
LRGTVLELQGDPAAARTQYETALRALEGDGGSESTDARVLKALGLTLAALGRVEEATRVGSRLVELLPISEDALWGPTHLEYRARIDARLGRVDEAIETLEQLLGMQYYPSITRSLLRLDPTWDRLRGNPGFDRLLVDEPQGAG